MAEKTITARVFRMDPSVDETPRYQEYRVPFEEGMSAMDVLDYIYQNLDGTLAYYDHAGCALGICARCNCNCNSSFSRLACLSSVMSFPIQRTPINLSSSLKIGR